MPLAETGLPNLARKKVGLGAGHNLILCRKDTRNEGFISQNLPLRPNRPTLGLRHVRLGNNAAAVCAGNLDGINECNGDFSVMGPHPPA